MLRGTLLSDYYKGELLTDARSRYDITVSTQSHPMLESLLVNKIKFNIGGLSFNYTQRPNRFKSNNEKFSEMIISKGSSNISSIYIPNIKFSRIGYGDLKTTNDAIIVVFSDDQRVIELYIARGMKYQKGNLYNDVIHGYLEAEMKSIKLRACNVLMGSNCSIDS